MSYSGTLQVKNNPSKNEATAATSQGQVYQSELIDFVYKEVIAALKKRKKGEIRKLDLDSLEVLVKSQRKADEQFRRSFQQ